MTWAAAGKLGLLAVAGAVLATHARADTVVELDGTSSYVSADAVPSKFVDAQFTVAMWIYPTPGISNGRGTAFSISNKKKQLLSLEFDRRTNKYSYRDGGSYRSWGKQATKGVTSQKWHWVALSMSQGTAVKVFAGYGGTAGEEIISLTDTNVTYAALKAATRLTVGAGWSNTKGVNYLSASVDEVRVWDQPLTLTELNFYMRSTIAEPTSSDNMHLIGYFPFSEGQGDTSADGSNSGLTAQLRSVNWMSTFAPYDVLLQTDATQDKAAHLDGARAYIKGDAALESLKGKALSVFAWAMPSSVVGGGDVGCVVAFNAGDGANQNMICYSKSMQKYFYKDGDNKHYMTESTDECSTVVPDTWHFVGFSIDAEDNGVLYVDGEPKATFKSKIRPTAGSRFSIGQEFDGRGITNLRSTDHFMGGIDEVMLLNRAVTQDEIKDFQSVVHVDPTKQTGLVAYWGFDEGSGSQSVDKSGFSHTAQFMYGASWMEGHSVEGSGGASGGGSMSGWAKFLVVVLLLCLCAGCFTQRDAILDALAAAQLDRMCAKKPEVVHAVENDYEGSNLLDEEDDFDVRA